MRAVYAAQDNDPMRSTATTKEREVQTRRDALALEQARVMALKNRILALEPALKNRPRAEQLAAATRCERAFPRRVDEHQVAKRAVEEELSKMQSGKGGGEAAPGEVDDAALRELNGKLTVLNARIDDAKAATAKRALDTRKGMADAMDQFQASLNEAQGLLKDNPAMKDYIASAQKLQETSWKLQNDLIDRQEKRRQYLVENASATRNSYSGAMPG